MYGFGWLAKIVGGIMPFLFPSTLAIRLAERLEKRLTHTEQRLDKCESRHEERDIREHELWRQLKENQDRLDECDEDRRAIHEKVEQIEQQIPKKPPRKRQ